MNFPGSTGEGERARIAAVQPFSNASRKASSAPQVKAPVTSVPSLATTRPPLISEGTRGVGSPPSISGHTGRACPVRTSSCTAGQGEQPPSYRQDSPARHALITYCLDMFGSILTPYYSNRIHVPARRRGGRSAPERRDRPFKNPQNQIPEPRYSPQAQNRNLPPE